MESKQLSAEESLSIISGMIARAQGNVQRNSFYFLFWGWTIALIYVAIYVMVLVQVPNPHLVWLVTIPAWIFTWIRANRLKNQRPAASHLDRISLWLWISFGVLIATLVVFGNKINYQLTPVILMITALPTLLSGVIIRFKPLMAGGIVFWVFGMISFLVPFDMQPLIGGLAIIGGYLVPGYLLKYKPN